LMFIAILYTTAPAVASFARLNFIDTVNESTYVQTNGVKSTPEWFKTWEDADLLAWEDKNKDGKLQYRPGKPFLENIPVFSGERGENGERKLKTCQSEMEKVCNRITENENELYINRDIIVLANPQIAKLPGWVVGLVVAGGLAAALSTAAGLLMVISSAVSHDLLKRTFKPDMAEKQEMLAARLAAATAVICAGLLGIFATSLPFVAQVVAFAFGLAAASLFPIIFLYYFKFGGGTADKWWFDFGNGGVSPEGIGFVFMWLSAAVGVFVSLMTPAPPQEIQDLVQDIRIPGQRKAHGMAEGGMEPTG